MFIITRMPKTRKWNISTLEARLTALVPATINITSIVDNSEPPMDGNEDKFNMFVILSDDLEMTKAYVKTLADRSPGVTYYISKPVTGFVCPAAPVKELAFSEKGVLPA